MTAVEPPGIDVARVTEWFADALPAVKPPLQFTLIAGGRSNLTYLVEGVDGQQVVLRRPPLGSVLSTAHAWAGTPRHRALATDVPVMTHRLLSDESVNGHRST